MPEEKGEELPIVFCVFLSEAERPVQATAAVPGPTQGFLHWDGRPVILIPLAYASG